MPLVNLILRRIIEGIRGHRKDRSAEQWDHALSSWASCYIGGTIEIDSRNSLCAILVSHLLPGVESILDVGCAGGTLAYTVGGCKRYFGVDISKVAISEAQHISAGRKEGRLDVHFAVSDLQLFRTEEKFDIIVFNEVLYYLNLDCIEYEIERYKGFLTARGLMIISLKKDEHSSIIYKVIRKKLKFIYGMIYQQQPMSPSFNITNNRETPAFLIGVFRP
jgi:SAM-dependent methyltransferase